MGMDAPMEQKLMPWAELRCPFHHRSADVELLGCQLLIMAAFARYHTYLHGSGNDTYLDITYFPKGSLKGLSIRDRVEVNNGGQYLAPNNRSFVYNRVMLTYQF